MLNAVNKIWEIDNRLWVGSPNDKNVIECHPTRDISEQYHLPNSFIYEDDDSEWYDLDTIEKLKEARVIAIGYTCIPITDGFSTTYLYVKAEAVLNFIEGKLQDCKDLDQYYKVFDLYGDLLKAIKQKEKSNA